MKKNYFQPSMVIDPIYNLDSLCETIEPATSPSPIFDSKKRDESEKQDNDKQSTDYGTLW